MNGPGRALGVAILAAVLSARAERTETDLSGEGWTADGVAVSVPHTWNAVDGADGIGEVNVQLPNDSAGLGSYARKRVVYRRALPDKKAGRRYFVRCEGASIVAEMRVNVRSVGRHEGAFTAFCFEVTEAMKPTGNELEIAVDNSFDVDIQPIDGDFTMFGGLYRPVWLIETDPVCIDPVTDGANGLEVVADPMTGRVTVKVRVLGGEGETQTFDIPDWKPWSPEEPNLYPIDVTIRRGTSTDTVRETVGFRRVEFRDDGFFYLNGKKRILRGVNRHQDRMGKGWAVSAADEAEDVRWIKAMGADAVRTSHYPQSPAFYALCDRQGVLVWTEVPNVNRMSLTPRGRENRLRQAREMVAQHRNRPSVVMWGLYNELYSSTYSMKPLSAEREIGFVRDLIRELDPSRPTVAATSRPERPELSALPTALGVNLYPGWYGADADTMNEAVDAARFVADRKTICVSEYGAGGSWGQHGDARARPAPRGPYHPCEYQAWVHAWNYRRIAADPQVWGSFAWEMFDSGADARREGASGGVNDKGLVTGDRRHAKDAFWFYKVNWSSGPVLHLVGSAATVVSNRNVTVVGFCNAGEVSLSVNGKVVGSQRPDAVKCVVWEGVSLRPGENRIELRTETLRAAACWTCVLNEPPAPFPTVSAPRRLTNGPKEHLLASYFAIDSWCPDNRYLLVLETELNGRLPEAGERCTLGLVDTQAGNAFIPVTTTACWNFQEAAMAHWLPNEKDTFLFNDCRDGKFVTVVLNWRTREERVLPIPVSAVSPDGTWAVSVNYARLYLTRPDYGYAGEGQDPREDAVWPADDGLWTMDLRTGESRLILPVSAGRSQMPPLKTATGGLAYYCHTVISRDGKKIFFLARSVDTYDKVTHQISRWQTTAFTVDRDGSNLRRCFRDGWAGSHFNWAPDGSHRMLVTAVWNGDRKPTDVRSDWSLVEFTVGEEEKVRRIGGGILDQDWHCVYSPDGRFMSGETYWNKNFERPWVLVRLADGMTLPVGSFFVPEAYRGTHWRCDLHARFRRDGRQLAFNSVHEGSRQVYVMDVSPVTPR